MQLPKVTDYMEDDELKEDIENKCDHFCGMHSHYDCLIQESEKHRYDEDDVCLYIFNYCPKCGEKLGIW